jgi:hypothetical protein
MLQYHNDNVYVDILKMLVLNMAARVHNVFSLAEILKIFLSETTKSIELWLCRNDHWVVLY